jgi:hypothetical protein
LGDVSWILAAARMTSEVSEGLHKFDVTPAKAGAYDTSQNLIYQPVGRPNQCLDIIFGQLLD